MLSGDQSQFFWITSIGIILLSIAGLYCIFVSKNLLRIIIGLELLTKGVTLLIILAGYLTNRVALTQTFIITVIVVEVVVIAVAAGIVVATYHNHGSLDVKHLSNLRG